MADEYLASGQPVEDREQRKFVADDDGKVAVNVVVSNLEAILTSLSSILSSVDDLEAFTDGLEGLASAANTLLTTIRDNADQLEGFTDGIETLISASNGLLTTIRDNGDTLEAGQATTNSLLTTIRDNADTLETLIAATNTLLSTINGNVDGLEGFTDGLETLITSTNTLLTTIRDNADTLETKIGDVVEAAPASDTASSGLNGRLQRIAQRLTSLITATTDRTQKTQITNGTIDGAITAATPALTDNGLVVRPLPYNPQKYAASSAGFVVAATPTDVFTVTGSGTKTIRVKKIVVSGRTTSGSPVACIINLVKRSTADSAGTRVAATVVPLDSTNAAGTATVGHYTANPTLGTLIGIISSRSITFQSIGLSPQGELVFEFETPIVLRGTAEQIAINFNSTSITGSSISCHAEWEEVA